MAKIKLVQVLCPARHLIAALAFDAEERTETETRLVLRSSLARNGINACGTCNTRELRFETVETNFKTMGEAGRVIVENNDISFIELHKNKHFKIHETFRLPVPSQRCVRCRKTLDAATGLQSKKPKESDISVCGYCGQIMLFDRDFKLRAASVIEMAEIKNNLKRDQPEVWRLVEQASRYFAARRARREN